VSISSRGNNKKEKRRKVSFTSGGSSVYILTLTLLAVGALAVISSTTTTILVTTTIAQELGNAPTTRQPGGAAGSSVCTSTQTDGGDYSQDATTKTIPMAGVFSSDAATGNATTRAGGGGSLSISEVRDYIKEACIALQVGDTEGAMDLLNLALRELGDDGGGTQVNNTNTSSEMTGVTSVSGAEGRFDEGVSVGVTSPFDDYDATAVASAG
jgi:hypothetical protein